MFHSVRKLDNMQPLRLCIFLAFIAVLRASGPSKKVMDFLSIISGSYDNKEQIQEAGDDHPFVQVRLIPVDIKCLRPDPVLYVEEVVDGTVKLLKLAVVKDGIEDTIAATIYSFTDYTKYKPGYYDADKLFNISCGDLQADENCIASYQVSSDGFLFGDFPQCTMTINENHPRFTVMHRCDSLSALVPLESDQYSPVEPYELRLTNKKYPLIIPPQDYVSPCDN